MGKIERKSKNLSAHVQVLKSDPIHRSFSTESQNSSNDKKILIKKSRYHINLFMIIKVKLFNCI